MSRLTPEEEIAAARTEMAIAELRAESRIRQIRIRVHELSMRPSLMDRVRSWWRK